MLISFIILALITVGGASATYLFEREESLLWRLSAGNIIGSAVFGITVFLLACLAGLNIATVLIAAAVAFAPVLLLKQKSIKQRFFYDKQKSKSQFQGTSFKKFYRFLYYAGILIILWLFFERAMIVTESGIFTGASQNMGDLPFHLGAIFSFTDGTNFPPQNPTFADAKFTYPFIADLIAAAWVTLGASVKNAMFLQNLTLGFSLVVLLERFVVRLTGNRLAGRIAPFLLIFSGGLGFLWFASDYWQSGQGVFEFLANIPRDYTISDKFRWGNSMTTLFITQRSLLLGMPLTIIVLGHLWHLITNRTKADQGGRAALIPSITVGLLAGTLPLIHAHSLFVLFLVTAVLLICLHRLWLNFIAFGIGVAIVAVPLLAWSLTGSASHLSDFISWHFGWDAGDQNFLWFWLKNTGLLIPILIAAFATLFMLPLDPEPEENVKRKGKKEKAEVSIPSRRFEIALFFAPFFLLFVVSNSIKLAPWEWDNIKVLIYWFVGSIPIVAWFLAWLWQQDGLFRLLSAVFLAVLIAAGAVDVLRVASGSVDIEIFDAQAVKIAEDIRDRTPPDALFVNAPTYNTAVVLTGRRSLLRYPGHLASHGIDYAQRENDLKKIYSGDATSELLMKKYRVEYVLIGPEVRNYANDPNSKFTLNEAFFSRYTQIAGNETYRVFKITDR